MGDFRGSQDPSQLWDRWLWCILWGHFFSASHPRICLGTFSTVSPVIVGPLQILSIQYFTPKSSTSNFHWQNVLEWIGFLRFSNWSLIIAIGEQTEWCHNMRHSGGWMMLKTTCLTLLIFLSLCSYCFSYDYMTVPTMGLHGENLLTDNESKFLFINDSRSRKTWSLYAVDLD